VGVYLRGRTEIGDGELYRSLVQLQREYLARRGAPAQELRQQIVGRYRRLVT